MWKTEVVYPWEHALLYVDGRFQRALPPGRHRLVSLGRKVQLFRLSSTSTTFQSAPVEVVSSDRFALKIAAAVIAKIVDARDALESQQQHGQRLHLLMAQELAALAAEQTLDVLIGARAELAEPLLERLRGKIPALEIEAAVITTLVMPPELRRMLTEVERAKHEGLAALERARGEHAALRSLANAARLLKDNPELMRLRTLQAVSPTGKGATLVLGQDALAAPRPEA